MSRVQQKPRGGHRHCGGTRRLCSWWSDPHGDLAPFAIVVTPAAVVMLLEWFFFGGNDVNKTPSFSFNRCANTTDEFVDIVFRCYPVCKKLTAKCP